MRRSGLPRLRKSGGLGMDANVPCVPSNTFRAEYLVFNVVRKWGRRTETECAFSKALVARLVPNRNSLSLRTPAAAKSTCSMMWCRVICVKKPAARVRAGAESPANAANGSLGVAKLEKTRLYHTTSGFNFRIIFKRRTGDFRLPNFQQRITLNPGSSDN